MQVIRRLCLAAAKDIEPIAAKLAKAARIEIFTTEYLACQACLCERLKVPDLPPIVYIF